MSFCYSVPQRDPSPHPPPTDKSAMYKGQAFGFLVRYMAGYGDVSTSLRYLTTLSDIYHLRSQNLR